MSTVGRLLAAKAINDGVSCDAIWGMTCEGFLILLFSSKIAIFLTLIKIEVNKTKLGF